MSRLFQQFKIRNLTLKNRIMMAPMCMYSADTNGIANDWHFVHYGTRAVGGSALVMLEATAVESCGRISDRDLGIWTDDQVDGLKRLVQTIKANGAAAAIQLGHAGRKSTVFSEPVIAPSAIQFSDEYKVPEEMNKEDIKRVIKAFRDAASRANKIGFDLIEIHGAHGYLINQFLSPLTNTRTDEYGRSKENRARFLKEIIKAVREVWPNEKPICLRVSAEDYLPEGNHAEDVADMINIVKAEGLDIVNVSSGGVVDVPVKAFSGYQVSFAETIKEATNLPVIAGGLITTTALAEETLNKNIDMIFLGRELLRNPYWPLSAAHELGVEIPWPQQYERAKFR